MYITLPSKGQFYPAGAIEYPDNGEIPVYPMTAIDEITYRTPDALFNGEATTDVIKSCVPAIKDPWTMPSIDFDTILVAIRAASYGPEADIETVCPKCGETSEFTININHMLAQVTGGDYSAPITYGDLQIYTKPISYKVVYDNQMAQFEEQQKINSIASGDESEVEKLHKVNSMLKRMTATTLNAMTSGIVMIKTPEFTVTNQTEIRDFITNIDRATFTLIRDKLAELRKLSELKPIDITCQNEECGYQYSTPFTVDQASFFAPGS